MSQPVLIIQEYSFVSAMSYVILLQNHVQ